MYLKLGEGIRKVMGVGPLRSAIHNYEDLCAKCRGLWFLNNSFVKM